MSSSMLLHLTRYCHILLFIHVLSPSDQKSTSVDVFCRPQKTQHIISNLSLKHRAIRLQKSVETGTRCFHVWLSVQLCVALFKALWFIVMQCFSFRKSPKPIFGQSKACVVFLVHIREEVWRHVVNKKEKEQKQQKIGSVTLYVMLQL